MTDEKREDAFPEITADRLKNEDGVFEVTVTFPDSKPTKSVIRTTPKEFAFQALTSK